MTIVLFKAVSEKASPPLQQVLLFRCSKREQQSLFVRSLQAAKLEGGTHTHVCRVPSQPGFHDPEFTNGLSLVSFGKEQWDANLDASIRVSNLIGACRRNRGNGH